MLPTPTPEILSAIPSVSLIPVWFGEVAKWLAVIVGVITGVVSVNNSLVGTTEGDRLEVLTTLVEAYEERYYPIPEPDPVEAIRYYMESRGLSSRDIAPYIGQRVQVGDILERKRPLSLPMIRRLHTGLGIPADVLIRPYAVAMATA